ncbi:MAG: DUF4838 domain-containing protein [Verrucomicrobia bacterium]|nr:DUF4838 domain-containing protein [Verrucomicrobiota bacterium]
MIGVTNISHEDEMGFPPRTSCFLSRRVVPCMAAFTLLLDVGVASAGEDAAVTLVAGSKAECMIVTQGGRGPVPGTEGERPLWQVVLDFQRILEKMTGAKIPMVSPQDVPLEGTKIYIGDVPLPAGIETDGTALDPRGYWIIAKPQALILRGKTEGGTINAIYGFLQDKLKVRWFFPSELFEVIPQLDTVKIAFCREIHNPSFKGAIFMAASGINQESEIWCERMRRDAGAFQYHAPFVHYLGYILDSARYGKTHPEFYPLLNGKRRIPPPGDRSAPQPCLSNTNLVNTVIEFCRNDFDKQNGLMVAIGENDSTDWCACEKCQAMDVWPLEKVNDMEQHSDRYFTFANQVAHAIAQSHPGKLIGGLAYNGTVTPPKKIAKLEPNLAIGLCLDTSQYYDANYKTRDYNILSVWKPKCKNVCTYDYLSLGWIAPRYHPHLYAQHLKEMHKQGILAVTSEIHPYWATFGPMLYLAGQLMWDVKQDPDAILNDLFSRLFGKEAGAEMKAYYGVFENAWMRSNPNRSGKYFEGWSSMSEQMAVYTLADLDKAMKHLERAGAFAKDPMAQQRIKYIDGSFDYSAALMRGWLTSDRIDAAVNGGDPQSIEKAKRLRDMLRTVSDLLKKEDSIYKATLLIDPICSQSYYKNDRADHFGIIRGQWAPRCNYSLRTGAGVLLKYYHDHKMAAEVAALENEFPADVLQAAKQAVAETLGEECIAAGNMEGPGILDQWQAGEADLSVSADAHSGKQSMKIEAAADMGRLVQSFHAEPLTKYKYDFWYKCSRPGALYMYVTNEGKDGNAVGDNHEKNEWTRVTGYFTTSENGGDATIGFCSWPGKPTLIDDVSIREIRASDQIACKKVDAGFPDWNQPTFKLDTADKLGTNIPSDKWRGPAEFSAIACLGWQDEGLRLVVKVKDVEHQQPFSGADIWQGDSIQFGFDMAGDGVKQGFGKGYDDSNDFLYGLAQPDAPDSQPELYCWKAPKGKAATNIANDGSTHRYSIKPEKGELVYDVLISWKRLGFAPKTGHVFGFNLVVFDRYPKSDGASELVWLQLTPGIAGSEGQSPNLWKKFVLTTQD